MTALIEVERHDAPVPPLVGWILIAYWPGPGAPHWKCHGMWETEAGAREATRAIAHAYRHVTLYRVEHDGR